MLVSGTPDPIIATAKGPVHQATNPSARAAQRLHDGLSGNLSHGCDVHLTHAFRHMGSYFACVAKIEALAAHIVFPYYKVCHVAGAELEEPRCVSALGRLPVGRARERGR